MSGSGGIFRRIDWSMIWWGFVLIAAGIFPLRWEMSLFTWLWAGGMSLLGGALFLGAIFGYAAEKVRDVIEARQETVKIMREYKTMDPQDKQNLAASRVVVEHLILNGARVDRWRWFGMSREYYDQADVYAVWEDANLYRAPRVGVWGDGTDRRACCYDMVNFFAGSYWCEAIEEGKATRWTPGGYEKARAALFGKNGA